jgi:carbon-monoxide dehydrogenase large subunit
MTMTSELSVTAVDAGLRWVRGAGRYVDDIQRPDLLHLAVLRSPYARARILRIEGGCNGRELSATLPRVGEGAAGGSVAVPQPVLPQDYVSYVGQPVAAVVADDIYRARDLLESIEVEYEPLPAVVDLRTALEAPPIHPGMSSNLLSAYTLGEDFDPKGTPLVVEETFRNERVATNPMEPRGVVVEWRGDRLMVWASTQSVHSLQRGFAAALGLPPGSVRVIQMDTGGAFGAKSALYPEYVVAAHLARTLRRPVKWIETRREHLQASSPGRGAMAHMVVFAERDGRIRGLRGDLIVDAGAFASGINVFAPRFIGLQMTGPYAIRQAIVRARGVLTNKAPLGPYRGAGRPEAAFFIERIMDVLADEVGLDEVEIRRRNASDRSFRSPLGLEVPPLRPFLDRAVAELGWDASPRGLPTGFSTTLLVPAIAPGEGVRIRVEGQRLRVWLGSESEGQDHVSFTRALLAEDLGIPPDRVDLERGDSGMLDEGVGTWGSRSTVVGGFALLRAAEELRRKVAEREGAYTPERLWEGTYDVQLFASCQGSANTLAAHLARVELEPTGLVRVHECKGFYDVGRPFAPAAIEGQAIGGMVQALGQVLTEALEYGADGGVETSSLGEAGLLRSHPAPRFQVSLLREPSSWPGGSKGMGESPTTGLPPAVVRAIEKASGHRLTWTPLRPEDLARNGGPGRPGGLQRAEGPAGLR